MILRRFDPLSCALRRVYASMNMSACTLLINKSPEYHHMVCIGKTKWTSEKGQLRCHGHGQLSSFPIGASYSKLQRLLKKQFWVLGKQNEQAKKVYSKSKSKCLFVATENRSKGILLSNYNKWSRRTVGCVVGFDSRRVQNVIFSWS